jgi:lysophospholipid acyltransferase (LPLAT)-like uncharacterized protein
MSADGPTNSTTRRPKANGVFVPHAPNWWQRLGAAAVVWVVRGVAATLRYQWSDRSGFYSGPAPRPAIYCAWHNRLAVGMRAYRAYIRKRSLTPGLAAMVSASKDGAFLAAILEKFEVQPVRGSSSRRGPQALLELTSWAERGYDLAITPDGPRGPCYVVQEGIMSLAQLSGLPIIPFSCRFAWKIRLKSWDRFQIPIPFSRCEMHLGPAIRVPREATDAERETLRQQLEQSLKALSRD